MAKAPKYFDYLHQHGQYLTDRFDIHCEGDSLEADVAHYRRRRSNENQYWIAGVYVRRLLDRMVESYLKTSQYDYGKQVGKKIHEGIEDGYIPRAIGYKMSALNELVRDAAHSNDTLYTASDLEAALMQLDVVFRTILESDKRTISGDEVANGTDDVLLAHSDSIEEKARQAAQVTGNEQLIEESRAANKRAKDAEHDALMARMQVEEAVKENEQLRLEINIARRTIEEQKAELNRREAAYVKSTSDAGPIQQVFARSNARLDAKTAHLESTQAKSDARLAETERTRRAKEAAANEAAEKVGEYEEYLDGILSEHDFISTLLGARGKATDEQRRIVNFPLDSTHKSRFVKVTGKAGTGKTLCLLAAAINYLEPNRQGTLSYEDSSAARRALFVCYNRDLASYISGLLERFPYLGGRIEVASYDQFLNQLVRTRPVPGFERLGRYAQDVRFHPVFDQNGVKHYWDLIVDDGERRSFIRQAIVEVRNYYQSSGMQTYCNSRYLNDRDMSNVSWMADEIEWLESRYHDIDEGESLYPNAERVGRGRGSSPRKNSDDRKHIIEVWKAFCWLLRGKQRYTFQQTVAILLRSKDLPTYDIVAVDEAQDLNMLHVELFSRFMTDRGFLLIAGDEGQKVYPRDFTWKEVDSKIKSITLPLSTNKRNPTEVRLFAERLESDRPLVAGAAHHDDGVVLVRCASIESTVAYIKELAGHQGETIAVVTTDISKWESLLRRAGIATETSKDQSATAETIRMRDGGVRPGVYCLAQLKTKGLEFDNVIVDYSREVDRWDERRERRIRYMQFTRARKTLFVRYEGEPPRLLQEYYPDFLEKK